MHNGIAVTRMRDDLPTLAGRFAESGYRTVSLSANAWLAPELGLVRGFQDARVLVNDFRVVEAALSLLDQEYDRPLFLFVNLMLAHAPFNDAGAPWTEPHRAALTTEGAPDWASPYLWEGEPHGIHLAKTGAGGQSGIERFLSEELSIPPEGFALMLDLYDSELVLLDQLFNQVFSAFAASRPNSIVAVTSDHGEFFGEHNRIEHRGHVYPEVLRVPLIIAAPGRLPAGRRVSAPVQMHDLYPTLLELADLESAESDRLPNSLLRVLEGEPTERTVTATAWPDGVRGTLGESHRHTWRLFRQGGLALIFDDESGAELYDLRSDPNMTRDLAAVQTERLDEMRASAIAYFAAEAKTDIVTLAYDRREKLRALGYLRD